MVGLFAEENREAYSIASGRRQLADELLLSYAAQGKIKLYARFHTKYGSKEEERSSVALEPPEVVPPEFIANSHIDFVEPDFLPTLIDDFEGEKDEYERYIHILTRVANI